MSCSADLPSVGRSAAVEATKEEKPQTVFDGMTAFNAYQRGDSAVFARRFNVSGALR